MTRSVAARARFLCAVRQRQRALRGGALLVVREQVVASYTRNPLRRFDFEIGIGAAEEPGEASLAPVS